MNLESALFVMLLPIISFRGHLPSRLEQKYFLIVPYVLREAVDGRYGKDANRVLRAIDSAEKIVASDC